MIEATCAACGTVNRIAEADVPVGAKFVSCTSCKSKVVLPAKAASGPAPGKPAARPIAIPALPTKLPTPARGVPTPARGVPAPPQKATIDLADLPAPKRQSALAGAEPGPKPAPRSALADAELPVPKSTGPKPPVPQAGSLDLDDLMSETASPAGLADLPAPKSRTSGLADLPAPKGPSKSALADLPAPKGKPTPTDLPAPKGKPTPTDLPAPKGKPTPTDLRAPRTPTPSDLPAPKTKPALADVPAPKAKPGPGGAAQPAPATAAQKAKPTPTDVAMPAAPTMDSLELGDLEFPAPSAGITDLPTPKSASDLPAPKGFFEDLPQPSLKGGGGIDLPAPKGFFEDLPQPAKTKSQDIAPKGFFDDLPQPAKSSPTQDMAPKGFFDDLPQPAAKAKTQDIAPKGFFDDLPQPTKTKSQELAPKAGLFDDLPQPGKADAAKAGLFDDLQAPAKSAADLALGAGDIDLGPATDVPALELDSSSGPELDLGLPLGESSANDFKDLDLSEPTKATPIDDSPIKIKTPAQGAAPRNPIPIIVPARPGSPGAEMKLDLADDPHSAARGGGTAASAGRITPKKKTAEAAASAEARAAKKRRSRLVLVAVLAVAALGGGGFYFYQRHAAAQARAEEVQRQIDAAQKALRSDDPKHWMRARSAAGEALEIEPANPRALGIAAEASIAGALDTGINQDARVKEGQTMIEKALGAGTPSPEIERAQVVSAIAAKGQAARAVDLAKAQIAKAPKDGWLHLYLGWAQLAKGDATEAVKAFEQAIAATPGTKLPALYGQGQAKLLLADFEGAKTAFATILEVAKDHVCANVGLIATKPPSKSVEQVAELQAVLARQDIKSADPRCVVQAHTLIGDVHRGAGRLEMARQSYNNALKLVPNDVPALVGLAAVELREGKTKVAADLIRKALAFSADHAGALLLQAELHVREGKLGDAEAMLDKLDTRTPPLPPLAKAQLFVVRGKLLEAKGQDEAAVDAYEQGAKLAGELDLTPTMAAVRKLGELAKKATDPAKAAEYRARAAKLLQPLEERAQDDAQLCITLGAAYQESGDLAKAELFLRRAVALEDKDPEARLQLAKTLRLLNKADEALTQLKDAQKLDPKRTDIALELAKTYQAANRHDDAVAAFETLLALPDVPIVVRVDAGKYFARRGMIDKAAAQAEPILKDEPANPGGLYLKAEGLLKANKPEEAQPPLTTATDADPDVQYLDALGRALEARWKKSEDTKYIEGARAAYERASKADKTWFHPWLGQGRMRVANKDWEAAIAPLLEASKIDKSSSEVMLHMGLAYHGLGRGNPKYKPTSAQWLESALKAQPALPLDRRADAAIKLAELYKDINKPRDAIRSYELAIRLGEELEKQGSPTPPWLVDAYYWVGDLYGPSSAQKLVFEKFVGRAPPPSERLKRAKYDLATILQRF